MKKLSSFQKIFNKVSKHLIKQNCKSTDSIGSCMYMDPDGNRCAAGCLIPKKAYPKLIRNGSIIEGKTVSESKYFRTKYNEREFYLISRLQSIHDSTRVKEWKANLAELANEVGLKYNGNKYV